MLTATDGDSPPNFVIISQFHAYTFGHNFVTVSTQAIESTLYLAQACPTMNSHLSSKWYSYILSDTFLHNSNSYCLNWQQMSSHYHLCNMGEYCMHVLHTEHSRVTRTCSWHGIWLASYHSHPMHPLSFLPCIQSYMLNS